MISSVRLSRTGGLDVLEIERIEPSRPGSGEVWIEQEAIGVNYLDVMQRRGLVPLPIPGGLGLEGAGRVTDVGDRVTDLSVGDRVAYILGPPGSYASGRLYPAKRLIRIPDDIDFDDAAAILFKGITAHYLLKTTYPVGPETVVLLYGAAGGVGQIMASWAKFMGASVIGVVSKHSSVERARTSGCNAVLVWDSCDVAAEVAKLTDGRQAHVVYDCVGRETFSTSMACVRTRGVLVSFGASTGAPPPIEVSALGRKSMFLTKPSLGAHASDLPEYRKRANDVLSAFKLGIIKSNVWKTFPLEQIAQAHAALEEGKSSGTIILKN